MVTTTPLRQLRLKYHISLIELSALSGIPNQRLSEYERGERYASLAKTEKVMTALVCLADARRKAAQALRDEIAFCKNNLLTQTEISDES